MDATFCNGFYNHINEGLFIGLTKATPNNFKISVKVPEIITREKRLDMNRNVITDSNEFLNKISSLESNKKLDAIIIQLPPRVTITESIYERSFLIY